ncbi:hypothetical protein [Schlesneria sp.]|uniref:hypothetical protein n=1 Tax=Schlesneria sp. TaxID=2762018 RepID=UPI002F03ABE4
MTLDNLKVGGTVSNDESMVVPSANEGKQTPTEPLTVCSPATTYARDRSQSIDWYSEGEERTIEVGDVKVTVRFVGRRGRRGRIALVAPAGAAFRSGHL